MKIKITIYRNGMPVFEEGDLVSSKFEYSLSIVVANDMFLISVTTDIKYEQQEFRIMASQALTTYMNILKLTTT